MKVKSESEVAQPCPTPSNPMDCRLPGSSVHGIFQARILEWVAIAFSVKVLYTMAKHYKPNGCDRPRRSKARGATPRRRPGAAARRSYHTPKVRGAGHEKQPAVQGAVAVRVQEGQEELLNVQGQEGQP